MALKKVEVQKFDLKKVKLNGKKGLSAEWFSLDQTNDLMSVNSDSQVSEDLIQSFTDFNSLFASSLGLLYGWDFAREHNRQNDESLKTAIHGYNDEISRCKVSGIILVGDDENPGIKITGSIECDLGSVGLSSPIIRFSDDELGASAETLTESLVKEVWSFIFKGKRGNDLFTEETKREESGLNNMKKVV